MLHQSWTRSLSCGIFLESISIGWISLEWQAVDWVLGCFFNELVALTPICEFLLVLCHLRKGHYQFWFLFFLILWRYYGKGLEINSTCRFHFHSMRVKDFMFFFQIKSVLLWVCTACIGKVSRVILKVFNVIGVNIDGVGVLHKSI
jgi:hypothetical protein